MGLWSAFMDAIPAYTGLSPMSFFTVVAVLYGIYHVAVSVFGGGGNARDMRSREAVQMEPVPEPVQLGEVTEEVLKAYDGSDPTKPLLMAIKGQIYDVTQSKMFYGPGGPYALFAGKDASRALSKMSFEEQDLNGNLEGLGPFELDTLQDWECKFRSKYVKVGTIKKSVTKEVEVTGSVTKEVEVTGSESKDDNEKTEELKENGDHSEPRDVSLNSEGRPEGESVSQIATESERHEANHPAEVDH